MILVEIAGPGVLQLAHPYCVFRQLGPLEVSSPWCLAGATWLASRSRHAGSRGLGKRASQALKSTLQPPDAPPLHSLLGTPQRH